MLRYTAILILALAAPVSAGFVSFGGASFPDDVGWERLDALHPADRRIEDGWFVQSPAAFDPGPPVIDEVTVHGFPSNPPDPQSLRGALSSPLE